MSSQEVETIEIDKENVSGANFYCKHFQVKHLKKIHVFVQEK